MAQAASLDLAGLVAKRADSFFDPGLSSTKWVKIRRSGDQEKARDASKKSRLPSTECAAPMTLLWLQNARPWPSSRRCAASLTTLRSVTAAGDLRQRLHAVRREAAGADGRQRTPRL
jgi:hypothetical protein